MRPPPRSLARYWINTDHGNVVRLSDRPAPAIVSPPPRPPKRAPARRDTLTRGLFDG